MLSNVSLCQTKFRQTPNVLLNLTYPYFFIPKLLSKRIPQVANFGQNFASRNKHLKFDATTKTDAVWNDSFRLTT